jgi:hypothetical protein
LKLREKLQGSGESYAMRICIIFLSLYQLLVRGKVGTLHEVKKAYIHIIQERGRWCDFVNTVMNLEVSYNIRNFLSG